MSSGQMITCSAFFDIFVFCRDTGQFECVQTCSYKFDVVFSDIISHFFSNTNKKEYQSIQGYVSIIHQYDFFCYIVWGILEFCSSSEAIKTKWSFDTFGPVKYFGFGICVLF